MEENCGHSKSISSEEDLWSLPYGKSTKIWAANKLRFSLLSGDLSVCGLRRI